MNAIIEALVDLVVRCDGPEGVRADGSNINTRKAHAALEEYEKEANRVSRDLAIGAARAIYDSAEDSAMATYKKALSELPGRRAINSEAWLVYRRTRDAAWDEYQLACEVINAEFDRRNSQ